MAPHEQRSSSHDPTPTPTEHTATDGASTLMDHRKEEIESNSESPSNQSAIESETSDSEALEEGEISNDSVLTLQETCKNSTPRNTSQRPGRRFTLIRNFPEPESRHFKQTLFKSDYRIKRIYYQKFRKEVINYHYIPDCNEFIFDFIFESACSLSLHDSLPIFNERLKKDSDKFNLYYHRKLSLEEYHAYLCNMLEISSDRFHRVLWKRGQP